MLAAAGAAGLAGALFGLIRPALLARLLRLGEGTGAARREIWAAARAAIDDSPWLGLGLDQFSHVDPARYGIPQIRFLTLAHPHNLVFDVWLQLGLLGVAAVGLLIGLAGQRLWAARRDPFALAAGAILVDLVVHGMLDQTLLGGDMIYVWLLVLLVAWQFPRSKEVVR